MNNLLLESSIKAIPETPQKFSHQFQGTILWNYHHNELSEVLSSNRLIKLAEKKHWSPYTDINWLNDSVTRQFPCIKQADAFSGFHEYEQLPEQTKLQISWQRHGMEISEILHGEQLAMLCASQLITLLPGMEGRLFASRQAAEEARHIEFFRAYLLSVKLNISPPSSAIRRLTLDALQSPHWEIKLLICQILIESLAMAQFSYLSRTCLSLVLKNGLQRIMDDEARHVKFGTDYLENRFQHHDAEQLVFYANFVVDKAFELASSDNHCIAIANPLHWDVYKLRHHLRQHRINQPESIRQRFRQLSINIRAIGLMSPAIEQRLKRFSDG